MKNKYFVLGGGILQKDFVTAVKRHGFETHVFDVYPDAICKDIADVFHCVSIDDKETILEVALKEKPVAIQTAATELGNISACWVGERLGLCTNSFATALNTTNKSLMKKIFEMSRIPTAGYSEISSFDELAQLQLKFPVVVKPADRSASRGVTMVKDSSMLYCAFIEAQNESNCGKVLVEDYAKGLQYSVEAVSSNGEHYVVAITEETFDGSDNLLENRHMLPAIIDFKTTKVLTELVVSLLSSFDVKFGASHTEIKISENGPQVIEVATRSGGLRDFMIKNALDLDYNDLIIQASLGQKIKFKYPQNNKYVVSAFLINESNLVLYNHLKSKNSKTLIYDYVNGEKITNPAKSLMDSLGFFYLIFDKSEDALKFIERENT